MVFLSLVRLCSRNQVANMTRILNVAEKNDAAKSLAEIMSRGNARRREGKSRYNKIYEFSYFLLNRNCEMTMTSVSGHLLGMEFTGHYKKWHMCNPVSLFEAKIEKYCPQDFLDIKKTLEIEVRRCQMLVIWTDCDREGENIGFEIIQVCKAVKPNIEVYRARFSEITPQAISQACNNLIPPDKYVSDAVDARMELDLRIGAAFTRFQTLRLQKVFPDILADHLISYGSCQFPTLGFVVERYKQVQEFVAEPFWKLKVNHKSEDGVAEFTWKRNRLFDYLACLVLYEHCLQDPVAYVTDVKSRPKSKWRPQPLDTVELEKLSSRKLKINAKETMGIAEKLYTQGFISYPRTETNMFAKDINLVSLIENQTQHPDWGEFASRVLEHGPHPRNGNKTDQAHPPIHPTKYTNSLQGNEKKVYDFIVRHFLATCSQDAQGQETTVEIKIAEEKFVAQGLMILARNYLDVYPYDKWSDKELPIYNPGQSFLPTVFEMVSGETSPPSLLTEADLIALMEKHGIGTDATHAEHIETIKSRNYVGLRDDGRFVPGHLGMGLVEGYDAMGYAMSKPHLRAELESDLKLVCNGKKTKDGILSVQIQKYKEVFIEAVRQAMKIDEALSSYLGAAQPYTETALPEYQIVKPCNKCGENMLLRKKKDNKGFYLGCVAYPNCRNALWFPDFVLNAEVTDRTCSQCQPGPVHLLKFQFRPGSVPSFMPNDYIGCVGGCNENLMESLNLSARFGVSASQQSRSQTLASNERSMLGDSGYNSEASFSSINSSNRRSSLNTNSQPSRGRGNGQSRGLGLMNSKQQPNNSRRGATDNEDGNTIMCNCNMEAILLTVRKEGPNTGRQFYKCRTPSGNGCDFFLWQDQSSETGNNQNDRRSHPQGQRSSSWSSSSSSFNQNETNDVLCKCQLEAKSLIVQKEGPNKGRPFYACPKPRGEGCNFFQWGDEGQSIGSNNNMPPPRTSGRGGHRGSHSSANKGQKGSSKGTRATVKCGLCGEQGQWSHFVQKSLFRLYCLNTNNWIAKVFGGLSKVDGRRV